jgi:hypothetical protein
LEFRAVVNAPGGADPTLTAAEVADYTNEFAEKGPAGADSRQAPYRWFQTIDEIQPGMAPVMEDRGGKRYVLLCARRPWVMTTSGTEAQAWGFRSARASRDNTGRPCHRPGGKHCGIRRYNPAAQSA